MAVPHRFWRTCYLDHRRTAGPSPRMNIDHGASPLAHHLAMIPIVSKREAICPTHLLGELPFTMAEAAPSVSVRLNRESSRCPSTR